MLGVVSVDSVALPDFKPEELHVDFLKIPETI